MWREFVWHYYHTGDEGCVNNVLKVRGQHGETTILSSLCDSTIKAIEDAEGSNVIELSQQPN